MISPLSPFNPLHFLPLLSKIFISLFCPTFIFLTRRTSFRVNLYIPNLKALRSSVLTNYCYTGTSEIFPPFNCTQNMYSENKVTTFLKSRLLHVYSEVPLDENGIVTLS